MRTSKRYTNTTFTHRVDHDGGRKRPERPGSSPQVCDGCGAVYRHKRWSYPAEPVEGESTTCPACLAVATGEWRGEVIVTGGFVVAHAEEIERLLRREAGRAAEDNPLARIVELSRVSPNAFLVTTTTEHLAKRLGSALEHAYKGQVDYGFSHEDKFAHVTWARD